MANWLMKISATATKKIPGGVINGGEYFVFDPANHGNNIDFNVQRFKEKMEILREEMQADIIIEEGGGKDKMKTVENRKSELVQLNDELSIFFLQWLHRIYWKTYDPTMKEGIVSGIYLDDAIDWIRPLVLQLSKINTKWLNYKYNPKLVASSVNYNISKIKDDILHKTNPGKF